MQTQTTIKETTIKLPNSQSYDDHMDWMQDIYDISRENGVEVKMVDASKTNLVIVFRAEYETEDHESSATIASLSFLASKGVEIGKQISVKTIRDCTTIAQDALEEWA